MPSTFDFVIEASDARKAREISDVIMDLNVAAVADDVARHVGVSNVSEGAALSAASAVDPSAHLVTGVEMGRTGLERERLSVKASTLNVTLVEGDGGADISDRDVAKIKKLPPGSKVKLGPMKMLKELATGFGGDLWFERTGVYDAEELAEWLEDIGASHSISAAGPHGDDEFKKDWQEVVKLVNSGKDLKDIPFNKLASAMMFWDARTNPGNLSRRQVTKFISQQLGRETGFSASSEETRRPSLERQATHFAKSAIKLLFRKLPGQRAEAFRVLKHKGPEALLSWVKKEHGQGVLDSFRKAHVSLSMPTEEGPDYRVWVCANDSGRFWTAVIRELTRGRREILQELKSLKIARQPSKLPASLRASGSPRFSLSWKSDPNVDKKIRSALRAKGEFKLAPVTGGGFRHAVFVRSPSSSMSSDDIVKLVKNANPQEFRVVQQGADPMKDAKTLNRASARASRLRYKFPSPDDAAGFAEIVNDDAGQAKSQGNAVEVTKRPPNLPDDDDLDELASKHGGRPIFASVKANRQIEDFVFKSDKAAERFALQINRDFSRSGVTTDVNGVTVRISGRPSQFNDITKLAKKLNGKMKLGASAKAAVSGKNAQYTVRDPDNFEEFFKAVESAGITIIEDKPERGLVVVNVKKGDEARKMAAIARKFGAKLNTMKRQFSASASKRGPDSHDFSMTFPDEKRASRFASAAMKLGGTKVTCEGKKVSCKFPGKHASAIFRAATQATARGAGQEGFNARVIRRVVGDDPRVVKRLMAALRQGGVSAMLAFAQSELGKAVANQLVQALQMSGKKKKHGMSAGKRKKMRASRIERQRSEQE